MALMCTAARREKTVLQPPSVSGRESWSPQINRTSCTPSCDMRWARAAPVGCSPLLVNSSVGSRSTPTPYTDERGCVLGGLGALRAHASSALHTVTAVTKAHTAASALGHLPIVLALSVTSRSSLSIS